MTYYRDLGTETQVVAGPSVRAVGWLHPAETFPVGDCADRQLARMREFADLSSRSAEALGWPTSAGIHFCEFCGKEAAGGNFAVPSGEVIYVAPQLLPHYVETHRYLPPAEFRQALEACPRPGTEEYRALTSPFRAT